MLSRGALIVLEGLDRSGKSTQAVKLCDYLNNQEKSARIQRFPDREEPILGPIIDNFLRNAKDHKASREFIHLLFSANRWTLAEKICKELKNGTTLIVDRYSYSGITYSLAKGLDPLWVCQPEVGLPKPDLVLFFDIKSEETSQRVGFGDELMERSEFQKLVYENFNKIFNNSYWKRINAADSIENVHESVINEVEKILSQLNKMQHTELKTLTLSDFGL